MQITYEINTPLQARAVAEVFQSSGIRRPVDDLQRIQRMLDQADITISAWDADRLVGVGRALTDHVYACYLSDLAVRKDYQRQGIGKAILAKFRETLSEEVLLLLLSAPEAMSYYPLVGFEKIDNAFMIQRRR